MGFPKDEITEALKGQKYDEVMATYLLLGRKAPEVSIQEGKVHSAYYGALCIIAGFYNAATDVAYPEIWPVLLV